MDVGWLLLLGEYPSYTYWRTNSASFWLTGLPPVPTFLQQTQHTAARASSWDLAVLRWVLLLLYIWKKLCEYLFSCLFTVCQYVVSHCYNFKCSRLLSRQTNNYLIVSVRIIIFIWVEYCIIKTRQFKHYNNYDTRERQNKCLIVLFWFTTKSVFFHTN